jgi:predicted membrane-bound mannosyltransferase
MMAMAAQKLLQKDQAEAAQKQAQQAAQDPLVQMQQQELQLKAQEVEIKKQKLAMDAAAKADQIEIEKARIEAQERIAGVQAGVKAAAEKERLDAEMRGQRCGDWQQDRQRPDGDAPDHSQSQPNQKANLWTRRLKYSSNRYETSGYK